MMKEHSKQPGLKTQCTKVNRPALYAHFQPVPYLPGFKIEEMPWKVTYDQYLGAANLATFKKSKS